MNKKKDLNYIAKVEKAIAEKYGEIAIQNPAKFWDEKKEKEYLEQLKEQITIEQGDEFQRHIDAGGFFIPKKLINRDTNRICPACGNYSFEKRDDVYMNKYECCFTCYLKRKETTAKWRKEELEKSDDIQK